MLSELINHLGYRRTLLTDGYIDADNTITFLVNDGIDSYGCFSGLAVTDDQFALATTNRHHGIDRLQAGLHRLMHRFPGNNPRCFDFDLAVAFSCDIALAINGNADTVDNPTDQRLTNGHLYNPLGSFNQVALFDMLGIAQDSGTNIVFFKIENHAHGATRKLEELAGHGLVESMDTGNTIANRNNGTGLADLDFTTKILNLLLDYRADFFCSNFHNRVPLPLC